MRSMPATIASRTANIAIPSTIATASMAATMHCFASRPHNDPWRAYNDFVTVSA